MRNGRKHTVAVSVGGVLGGLVGTAAIEKAMGLSRKLPEPLQMPEMAGDPGDFVVSRAEELVGGPLSKKVHARAARAARWTYGIGLATALAALSRRLRMYRLQNAVLAGATLGALNWAVSFAGWLPATGLTKPIAREKRSKEAAALLGQVLFGVLAAMPIYAAERFSLRRRIPRILRRLM
jgi:hypothetical protein